MGTLSIEYTFYIIYIKVKYLFKKFIIIKCNAARCTAEHGKWKNLDISQGESLVKN